MQVKRVAFGSAVVAAAFLGGLAGSWIWHPEAPEASMVQPAMGQVVGTFGVGGVLTANGKLWQYRPDKKQWMTLDESFALEGQGTNAVPLPIPVTDIKFMETFGFLVSQKDECWLYDIDQHQWTSIGEPPR